MTSIACLTSREARRCCTRTSTTCFGAETSMAYFLALNVRILIELLVDEECDVCLVKAWMELFRTPQNASYVFLNVLLTRTSAEKCLALHLNFALNYIPTAGDLWVENRHLNLLQFYSGRAAVKFALNMWAIIQKPIFKNVLLPMMHII